MASLFNSLGCSSTRDSTKKFFVHKKDCQSLNGMIDLSKYQPAYNIKIIFYLQYSFMNSQKVIQHTITKYPRRVLIVMQRYPKYIKHIVLVAHNNALQ